MNIKKGGDRVTISKEKVDLILAEKRLSVTELCKTAGFSRNRFYAVTNSKRVTPKTVGRFAEALEVTVTEILE